MNEKNGGHRRDRHWLSAQAFHFDIDRYLNRIVPRSILQNLPTPISRFLGYRNGPKLEVGNLLICLYAFIGTFVGLVLVSLAFRTDAIQKYHPPSLLASFVSNSIYIIQVRILPRSISILFTL
jgi:hypothetical protein